MIGLLALAIILGAYVFVLWRATLDEQRRRDQEMSDTWKEWREYQRRLAAGEVGPDELPAADPRLINYPA